MPNQNRGDPEPFNAPVTPGGLSHFMPEKAQKRLIPKIRLIAEISKTLKSGDMHESDKEENFCFPHFP